MLNKDPGAEYVRGTKCDIRVKSSGESTHFVRSPGFPSSYPKNVECTYILDGMQGRQKLEHVSIEFLSFNVISDSLE
uniref:CUB domain-containing protein n=1 Tax=Romanomermis culicivorax TaxID=13658 RepID=A0A915KE98_ROMCU